MILFSISEREVDKFASLSEDSANYLKTVQSLWNDRLSYPEWCFVLENDEGIIGRIGYWASLDNQTEINIFGLALPWDRDNWLSIGQKLIIESMQKMKMAGAKSVNYQLHSDDNKFFPLSKQIFELVGMEQIQSKVRFTLTEILYNYRCKNKLFYKSLIETGESLFVQTIEEVTKETLDREDKSSISQFGGKEAAKSLFGILKSLDFSMENWFLAYRGDKIVGLIIPQKFTDDLGAINYIGVTLNERGKGYVLDLLDQGINNLFSRNIKKIIADIDELNYPMEKALIKVGFKKEEKKILTYRLIL